MSIVFESIYGEKPDSLNLQQLLRMDHPNISSLRDYLIHSSEYQSLGSKLFLDLQLIYSHPFHFPRSPIEIICSDDQLQALFTRTKNKWCNLGSTEPYWSTITQSDYLYENFSNFSDEFFNSGGWVIDLIIASMNRVGISLDGMSDCLEFGCGVGRVTSHLQKIFPNITAVDISAGHLRVASEVLKSQDQEVNFLELFVLEDLFTLPRVDFVISIITLQHNPPPLIFLTLQILLNCLNPSGVAFIQIPTYCSGYLFETSRYLANDNKDLLEMHYFPQSCIFELIESSGCKCIEVREDRMIGAQNQMLSNTFLIQKNE